MADNDDKRPPVITHYVWITTITDYYTEALVGRLVRRGWSVGALGGSLSLHSQEKLSAIVALMLSRQPKDDSDEVTSAKVLEDVKDVLKVLGVKWHSLVVTLGTGCTWTLGNVTQTEAKKAEEERKKTVN